jgi:FMN phosphatase YigB (HAD superfamily)
MPRGPRSSSRSSFDACLAKVAPKLQARRELERSGSNVCGGTGLIVIFDLDDTLVKNPFGKGVLPHIQRIMSREGSKTDCARAFRQETVRLRREGRLVDSFDWDFVMRNIARANRIHLGIEVAELVRTYSKAPFASLEPGANELLKSIHESGHRIVILTNGYEKYQLPLIESLGLENYDLLVTPDKIGYIKPQPEAFKLAARPFITEKSREPVVVGDSILFDIWGASLTGFRAIWLRKDREGRTGSVRLSDLGGLVRRTARREGLEGLVKGVPNLTVPVVTDLRGAGKLV